MVAVGVAGSEWKRLEEEEAVEDRLLTGSAGD